jgi:hypothetical protein
MKNTQKLLTFDNAKTIKGEAFDYKTAILYLAPHKQNSFRKNICALASPECIAACLYTSGMGKFSNVQKSRIKKTDLFIENKDKFLDILFDELNKYQNKFKNLAVRLNGTSDIPWENFKYKNNLNLFELFPNIQFYDYTKHPKRILTNNIKNYHLTYSYAETKFSKIWTKQILKDGQNVAAVVSIPLYNELKLKNVTNICGINLVDGDQNDLRFLDPINSLIYLKAKGEAKKIKTLNSFVLQNLNELINLLDNK